MASEALTVVLSMQAEQYKRQAREAAAATGAIGKEASGATTATQKLQGGMSYLGTTAKLAVVGGAIAAGAAVVGFAKDSVRAATDLNESINAVNVVFGDAADGVLALGENAADSFGLAQSEFNGFAVQFSNFAQTIAQESGQDVTSVIEDLMGRISDFASVMNLDIPEAAEKFQSGLAGEIEPLRKFGIDVSAARVQQKALELGLADTTAELTEQDKVLARYEIIMEETNKTAGDFKNTQDELANATRTLNANFEDFKARVGEEFTPVLATAVQQGNNLLDVFDGDINLGWTQRLSAGLQTILGEDGVEAYIDQKVAINDVNDVAGSYLTTIEKSIGASNRHRGATKEVEEAQEDVAEAFEGTELAIQNAADAIAAYDDAFRRLTDPVFRHLDDQRALQQAYEDYNAVMEDAEATTADQEAALFDLLAAQQEVNTSGAALPETMGRSEQAFRQLADQLGLTEEQAATMLAVLEDIDGQTFRADIEAFFRVGGNLNAYDAIVNGQAERRGQVVFRASGGPLSAGQAAIVGERGPELFIPSTAGMVIPNSGGGAASIGPTVYIGTVYGFDDFAAKVREANISIGRTG